MRLRAELTHDAVRFRYGAFVNFKNIDVDWWKRRTLSGFSPDEGQEDFLMGSG